MARKKADKGSGEEMQATAKKSAGGRRPGGPFWHATRGQWVCRLNGRSFYAPKTIGEASVDGARRWYLGLARAEGIEPGSELPGSETAGGLRKLVVSMTAATAAELAELDPLVASEQLSATTNFSRTVSVAIHEALARRKGGAKAKG